MESMMQPNACANECDTAQTSHRKTIALVVGVAVIAVTWYLFRPELLFVNQKVNESFPVTTTAMSTMARGGQTSGAMSAMTTAPTAKTEGIFHDGAHATKGTASIYELATGNRVLRLTNFETSNGPDVHVLLGKAADATDSQTVKRAGYFDLGSLKGNVGDQNYSIPGNVQLSDYNSVTIWCNRFNVNFGTAPLASK